MRYLKFLLCLYNNGEIESYHGRLVGGSGCFTHVFVLKHYYNMKSGKGSRFGAIFTNFVVFLKFFVVNRDLKPYCLNIIKVMLQTRVTFKNLSRSHFFRNLISFFAYI